MTDDELDQIVKKFTNAETALRSFATREAELRAAAAEFLKAGQAMERVQREGAEGLDAARADFSQAAEATRVMAASAASILEGLGTEVKRVSALTQQLRDLEPDRLASDLGELRRDVNDQAVELRELRRLESEVTRSVELMERRLSENSEVLDDVETAVEATKTELAATAKNLKEGLAAAQESRDDAAAAITSRLKLAIDATDEAIKDSAEKLHNALGQQALLATERTERQDQQLNQLLTVTTLVLLAAIAAVILQIA